MVIGERTLTNSITEDVKASEILQNAKVKQCKGHYSCDDGGFCAFGALMNFFGWKGEWTKTGRKRTETAASMNPYHQKAEALLNEGNGLFDNSKKFEVIRLNDNEGWTFKKIAKWLRDQGL